MDYLFQKHSRFFLVVLIWILKGRHDKGRVQLQTPTQEISISSIYYTRSRTGSDGNYFYVNIFISSAAVHQPVAAKKLTRLRYVNKLYEGRLFEFNYSVG